MGNWGPGEVSPRERPLTMRNGIRQITGQKPAYALEQPFIERMLDLHPDNYNRVRLFRPLWWKLAMKRGDIPVYINASRWRKLWALQSRFDAIKQDIRRLTR